MHIVSKQDQVIKHLSSKVVDLEKQSMKNNVVITGLNEKNDENCKLEVKEFFRLQMRIAEEVPIEVAHRIGEGKHRPMVVRVAEGAKGKIFSKVGNLCDITNEDGRKYYVNDQLPDELNERRRKNNYFLAENKIRPVAHQLQMLVNKGKLSIANEEYKRKVDPLLVPDIVCPREDWDRLSKIKFTSSKQITEKGSTFCAFAMDTTKLEEV